MNKVLIGKKDDKIQTLHNDLGHYLTQISKLFKEVPQMTLVIHNPSLKDGDVVFGNGDLDKAVEVIQTFKQRQIDGTVRSIED